MEEGSKEEAYTRAVAVVRSCRTREQLTTARNYVDQFAAAYGECEETTTLKGALSDADKRLFPDW